MVFGVGLLAAIFLGREVSYSAILVVPLLCWLLYGEEGAWEAIVALQGFENETSFPFHLFFFSAGAIVLMGVQFVQSDIVGTSS